MTITLLLFTHNITVFVCADGVYNSFLKGNTSRSGWKIKD